jgi:hypothetical protein
MRAMFDAVTQYVDHATLADFALQTRKEFLPGGAVVAEIESGDQRGLRGCDEGA